MPLALLALAGMACPAEPCTEVGLRRAEAVWVAALEQRDLAALDCRLTADFTDNDWQGGVRRRTRCWMRRGTGHRRA